MSLSVPKRFNGPLESGNGGYAGGILAAQLPGPVEVSLRSPVPLDTPLATAEAENGSLQLLDGETLVAEARSVEELDLAVPAPVDLATARRASSHYKSPREGIFSRCFVCGPAREDSLGVFAGLVEGREIVATPWTPPNWTADAGRVRPEFVWAVLDCPTYFAAYPGEGMPLSMLVRQSVRIDSPIAAGTEHVIIAWPLGVEGRKRQAGAAVLSAEGNVLATCQALLVEPRDSTSD